MEVDDGSKEEGKGGGEGCSLFYVSADLKTSQAWQALASRIPAAPLDRTSGHLASFDLIFSDAWHSAAAVTWELSQLVQRRLLPASSVLLVMRMSAEHTHL